MFETTSENTALSAENFRAQPTQGFAGRGAECTPACLPEPSCGKVGGSGGGFEQAQITLQVNGETQNCSSPINLPELLNHLGLNPRLVAVEYNGEILHRQYWADTQLHDGDNLEIVTIVGGG